jgi:hypothetical protein
VGALPLRRSTAPEPYAASHAAFERLVATVDNREAERMDQSDMERLLAEQGSEVLRQLLQDWVAKRAAAEVPEPVVDAEGRERTRKRVHTRELETIFGTVTVERTGYGAPGEESLHPLDAALNLPEERYSLEVRRRAAIEASKSSFDETVETLACYTAAHVPKRQVEELVQRAAQDFDAFYESRRQDLPEPTHAAEGSLLVITTDGKGVVMKKEDLRPATRKAAEKKPTSTLRTRLTRGEKRNRKRMATVAAVYTITPYVRKPAQVLAALQREQERLADRQPRPRPEEKRVWASVEKDAAQVVEEAFHDAFDRDPDASKTWVGVVDGQEAQLALLESMAEKYGVKPTIVLDIFHVLEYVWKAGRAFCVEGGRELEEWVFERVGRILEGHATRVAAGMRRSATKRKLSRTRRAPVDTCANYLLKYQDYLAYDQYLAAGFPIATGVIEGACRHLVNDRLGITGARWRLTSAEAVLRLRSLRSSGDFDEYWRFHEAREHERNHQARYAGRPVSDLTPSAPPDLQLIP